MNTHDTLAVLHNILIFAVFLIIAAKVALSIEHKRKKK